MTLKQSRGAFSYCGAVSMAGQQRVFLPSPPDYDIYWLIFYSLLLSNIFPTSFTVNAFC
jgi:hypothetical protein